MLTRVLLWDQREIIRAGIKSICCQRDDLQFVGEASEQESAIALAQAHLPDVVILEMALLQDSAQQVFERFISTNPLQETKILVLADENGLDVAARMMQAGASGYLTHHSSLEEITVAIHCIAKGRIFISHSHAVVPGPKYEFAQTSSPHPSPASEVDRKLHGVPSLNPSNCIVEKASNQIDLSGREREVLSLIAEGMTNKQAAAAIFLSVKTVETYRSRIMKKHGLQDRVALVKFAASIGMIKDKQPQHCEPRLPGFPRAQNERPRLQSDRSPASA